MINWLNGRKTYIIAIATVVLGTLQGLGVFVVPEWAWGIAIACGLATLRAGVDSVSKTVEDAK